MMTRKAGAKAAKNTAPEAARSIASPAEFFAYALAIEREAADRYTEFARFFLDRDEEVIAALCRKLAVEEQEHFVDLTLSCSKLNLPKVDPQYCTWIGLSPPTPPARATFYRVTTPRQLLSIALAAEFRAHQFFAEIARSTSDAEVRELAGIMASEEAEHMRWVREALEYYVCDGLDLATLLAEALALEEPQD